MNATRCMHIVHTSVAEFCRYFEKLDAIYKENESNSPIRSRKNTTSALESWSFQI